MLTWLYSFTSLLDGFTFQANALIANVGLALLLLIPISFVYAYGKYNLLEVEAKLKRGTRFLAVNLLLLLAFFGFLYVFGEFVLEEAGISSQTPTLVLGILLALLFMPTQRKIRSKIEEHFYPERIRLRH